MNSIKNAIVTLTLLAVGYGAYVVLQSPPPEQWQQQIGAGASGHDSPPPAEQAVVPNPQVEWPMVSGPLLAANQYADISADSAAADANLPNPFLVPPGNSAQANLSGAAAYPLERNAQSLNSPHQDVAYSDSVPSSPDLPALAVGNTRLDAASPAGEVDNGNEQMTRSDAYEQSRFAPDNFESAVPTEAVRAASEVMTNLAEAGHVAVADTANGLAAAVAAPGIDAVNSHAGEPALADGNANFENDWLTVQQFLAQGNLAQALAKLSDWYGEPTLSDAQYARMLPLLDELAGTVIYSRQHILEPEYHVQPGESLVDIARAYEIPEAVLARLNGVAPPHALASNETLKVLRGPFRAEVSVGRRELTLFLNRYYAGRFSVDVGRDLPADEAFYEVAEKSDGRSYFDRRLGIEVLKGESNNRYGDHWVGLRGDQITAGHSVGIHSRPLSGAGDPENGCISLEPQDADDVRAILSIGSRIHVRR